MTIELVYRTCDVNIPMPIIAPGVVMSGNIDSVIVCDKKCCMCTMHFYKYITVHLEHKASES